MKNIILKISLLLIASSFSLNLYPSSLAAKEKTVKDETPGGGAPAAPAIEELLSIKHAREELQQKTKEADDAQKRFEYFKKIKEYIKDGKDLSQLPKGDMSIEQYIEYVDMKLQEEIDTLHQYKEMILPNLQEQLQEQVELASRVRKEQSN